MSDKNYICPVCGWDELSEPANNHNICPCCMTHFAYDDYNTSHEELRKWWVDNGMRFGISTFKPENWNPTKQLETIGVSL